MRKISAVLVSLLLAAMLAAPAHAQAGLEEGSILSATKYSGGVIAIYSSTIDTIVSTGNDTTGIMQIASYSATAPNIVYTVASGGTVELDLLTQVAPTTSGPWYTVAHDSITATGSSVINVSEFTTYKMPYVRILVDGTGSNDAATSFTALYIVWVLDNRYTQSWVYWRP